MGECPARRRQGDALRGLHDRSRSARGAPILRASSKHQSIWVRIVQRQQCVLLFLSSRRVDVAPLPPAATPAACCVSAAPPARPSPTQSPSPGPSGRKRNNASRVVISAHVSGACRREATGPLPRRLVRGAQHASGLRSGEPGLSVPTTESPLGSDLIRCACSRASA